MRPIIPLRSRWLWRRESSTATRSTARGCYSTPFAGSGSSLLVALRGGMEAVGTDINPTYLAKPEARTEIHAELPARHRLDFEREYAAATKEYPLPDIAGRQPYYVWLDETNKQGRELRIRLGHEQLQWRPYFRVHAPPVSCVRTVMKTMTGEINPTISSLARMATVGAVLNKKNGWAVSRPTVRMNSRKMEGEIAKQEKGRIRSHGRKDSCR